MKVQVRNQTKSNQNDSYHFPQAPSLAVKRPYTYYVTEL
jgi:hypothetical protein